MILQTGQLNLVGPPGHNGVKIVTTYTPTSIGLGWINLMKDLEHRFDIPSQRMWHCFITRYPLWKTKLSD